MNNFAIVNHCKTLWQKSWQENLNLFFLFGKAKNTISSAPEKHISKKNKLQISKISKRCIHSHLLRQKQNKKQLVSKSTPAAVSSSIKKYRSNSNIAGLSSYAHHQHQDINSSNDNNSSTQRLYHTTSIENKDAISNTSHSERHVELVSSHHTDTNTKTDTNTSVSDCKDESTATTHASSVENKKPTRKTEIEDARKLVYEHKQTLGCQWRNGCQVNIPRYMDCDHLDRNNKKGNISDMIWKNPSLVAKELENIQPLCLFHHRIKTYRETPRAVDPLRVRNGPQVVRNQEFVMAIKDAVGCQNQTCPWQDILQDKVWTEQERASLFDFDHLSEIGKSCDISDLVNRGNRISAIMGEIYAGRCILLCGHCHRDRTYGDPHGRIHIRPEANPILMETARVLIEGMNIHEKEKRIMKLKNTKKKPKKLLRR